MKNKERMRGANISNEFVDVVKRVMRFAEGSVSTSS